MRASAPRPPRICAGPPRWRAGAGPGRPRHDLPRLRHHGTGRSGAAGVTGPSCHPDRRCGTPPPDRASTLAPHGPQGACLLQSPRRPGASMHPGVRLRSRRRAASWSAAAPAQKPAHQRRPRLAPAVAAGHPGHGSQTDRSCLDDGRVVERSRATETPVVITPKALVPVIGTRPINVGPDSCERVSSSPYHPTFSRSVRPV